MDARYDVLTDAARLAREFVDGLPDRHVGPRATAEELRAVLARPLTEAGEDPRAVIEELARDVEPGLIASAGPRYFGFVVGGAPRGARRSRLERRGRRAAGRARAAGRRRRERAGHDREGPQIVCAQAGEVNSGAFGAFGLWAAVSPSRRGLLSGYAAADSWATDGHKWLDVPYDCGIAIVADPERQRGAMSMAADYIPADDEVPWGVESMPEFSRRARGIPVYAALRALGCAGLTDLVDRCCDHARLMADRLAAADGVEVLNDVVLNQVLVRFGDDDAHTLAVIDAVQRDGTCWASGSRWQGREVMRISVVGWQTTSADAERSAAAILAAHRGS